MDRYTHKSGSGASVINKDSLSVVEDGFEGEAADRLAAFENLAAEFFAEQEKIAGEIKKLKDEGKEKTVKFKELMGRKLVSVNTEHLFKKHGFTGMMPDSTTSRGNNK